MFHDKEKKMKDICNRNKGSPVIRLFFFNSEGQNRNHIKDKNKQDEAELVGTKSKDKLQVPGGVTNYKAGRN